MSRKALTLIYSYTDYEEIPTYYVWYALIDSMVLVLYIVYAQYILLYRGGQHSGSCIQYILFCYCCIIDI